MLAGPKTKEGQPSKRQRVVPIEEPEATSSSLTLQNLTLQSGVKEGLPTDTKGVEQSNGIIQPEESQETANGTEDGAPLFGFTSSNQQFL